MRITAMRLTVLATAWVTGWTEERAKKAHLGGKGGRLGAGFRGAG